MAAKKTSPPPSSPLWIIWQRLRTDEDAQAQALNGRWDLGFALLAGLLPLMAYTVTLSDQVLLEDDGLLIGVGHTLGIAHPPGYPLYSLLVWGFMQLPFSTPALAAHAFSALVAGLSCSALYLCIRLMGLPLVLALGGAVLFGIQDHVWSQAIRAEVYSLHLLLALATLALILQVRRTPERRLFWFLGAGVAGLAMANHWPLYVLAAPGFLALLWPLRQQATPLLAWLLGLMLGVAGALYGFLIIRSGAEPFFSFSGPIDSLGRFFHIFLRRDFSDVDNSATAGWPDRLQFMGWFLWQHGAAFTLGGLVLAILGAIRLHLRHPNLSWGLAMIWFGQGLGLLLLLNFDYDQLNIAIFRVYSLLCYGILAIWLVVGLGWLAGLAGLAGLALSLLPHTRVLRPAVFMTLGALPLLALTFFYGFQRNNLQDFSFTQEFAAYLNDRLPEQAILSVHGDFGTAVFGYHHHVQSLRSDIQLVQLQGLIFADRLYPSATPQSEKIALLEAYARDQADRPLYFLSNSTAQEWCPSCTLQSTGMLTRGHLSEPANADVEWNALDLEFLQYLVSLQPEDAWVRMQRGVALSEFGRVMTQIFGRGEPSDATMQALFYDPKSAPWLHMGGLNAVLQSWNPASLETANLWLELLEAGQDQLGLTNALSADYLNMKAALSFYNGDPSHALDLLDRSIAINSAPSNQAYRLRQQISQTNP